MKRLVLLTVAFAAIGGSAAQVKAADCNGNVSACINGNAGKPNAVAKCQAAGQRCAKSGVFVGPFTGQLIRRRPRNVAAGAAGPERRALATWTRSDEYERLHGSQVANP